jgi:regulator of ribonuclease activity B
VSDDTRAIAELIRLSDADAPHTILHYVYVPSSEVAALIAGELRLRGFRTEQRLGADGSSWLVLARHETVPSELHMASTRRFMETLVASVGGEYDGWEAEVRRQDGGSPSRH